MRNQFYSDRKDIWKWSLLLRLAGDTHHVYQVAMLTRDRGKHRLDVSDPGPCNDEVRKFFEMERFQNARDIYRVEQLLPGRITVLPRRDSQQLFYDNGRRHEYFSLIRESIDSAKSKVVFLDPDNGLEIKNSDYRHVRQVHLQWLWEDLAPGDYLVLYQHHDRAKGILARKKQQLANGLRVKPVAVEFQQCKGVTFLWLRKGSAHRSHPLSKIAISGEIQEGFMRLARRTGHSVEYHIRTAMAEYLEDREDYLAGVAALKREERRVSLLQLERELGLSLRADTKNS